MQAAPPPLSASPTDQHVITGLAKKRTVSRTSDQDVTALAADADRDIIVLPRFAYRAATRQIGGIGYPGDLRD
jgi:hypothetical protein